MRAVLNIHSTRSLQHRLTETPGVRLINNLSVYCIIKVHMIEIERLTVFLTLHNKCYSISRILHFCNKILLFINLLHILRSEIKFAYKNVFLSRPNI